MLKYQKKKEKNLNFRYVIDYLVIPLFVFRSNIIDQNSLLKYFLIDWANKKTIDIEEAQTDNSIKRF